MARRSVFRGILPAIALGLSAFCAAPALAAPYRAAFDPGVFKYHGPHKPNEVMVLGGAHLPQLPVKIDDAMVEPLMQRLAAWKPQEIAIENLSGIQCWYLLHYPGRYNFDIDDYCIDTAPARLATGLDVPSATAEMDSTFARWPDNPSAAQRRHLAALMLAAGDEFSAFVQWLYLPRAERRAGDGISAALVKFLDERIGGSNESLLIAARLAVRLGLQRVWPIDDHTADTRDGSAQDRKAAGEAIGKAWDNPATARRKALDDALAANLGKPGAVLAMYRAYNDPAQAMEIYRSDFGAAMNEPSPGQYGRGYAGSWDVRNLRMAANIRDVLARHPGTRMLVFTGASHKFYLEDFLDRMSDVQLVDAEKMLR
ncbi:DUF5694 domain-containing protein [Novosphingobium sp. ZN18A2]|uniref:DUF5694 domain-containing protein n=1 Tax=Novosphingobium sp. ZN18A2 TaxID=3079861 RepID=UPI0030D0701E